MDTATNEPTIAFPTPEGITKYHTTPYASIDVTRPELSAAGKVVLITGGGSGLGFAFAQHFAMAGCTSIVITGRRQDVIDDAKRALEKEYSALRVLAMQGDVTDKQAVVKAFETTTETFGAIDVLINNAGYLPSYTALASSDPDDWWKAFETNVRGSFNVLSSFLFSAASDAVVINLTSASVNAIVPGQSAYSASKVATTRLFETFAIENPKLRVVNIAPGVVLTDMHQKTVDHFDKEGLPDLPLDDIKLPASYLVWAASAEAEFIKDKFVWVHWDVDELRQIVEKSEDKQIFMLSVNGMPTLRLG